MLYSARQDDNMKIGIVTEYFYPTLGGIGENVYHFSKELLKHGHDFRIITGFRGEPKNIDKNILQKIIFVGRNIPVFFNGSCGRLTLSFDLSKKIREIFRREKFDLIHLHSPLFPTLPVLANLQSDMPTIGTFHTCMNNGIYYKLYQGKLQKIMDRLSKKIAVSECCARENQNFFDANFTVIPNGVDVKWWSENAKKIDRFNDGRINILFIGRPDTRNGLDTLIFSFTKVHKKHPNTRLIVVGDGPLLYYFKKLVPRYLERNIIFEGESFTTRPDYMASADIFCFTPTIASFGVTILEGMSAGKAMVASDIAAFRALVTHNESALLVTPKNEDEHEMAICRLIEDKNLRTSLGEKAFSLVSKYDWKNVAQTHIECYEQVLKL